MFEKFKKFAREEYHKYHLPGIDNAEPKDMTEQYQRGYWTGFKQGLSCAERQVKKHKESIKALPTEGT